jgi:hypothetical protein
MLRVVNVREELTPPGVHNPAFEGGFFVLW